jgi:uncharacterized membrane protein YhaH (DUF805 family)
VKWYIEVMRKYAVFSGRARRLEYWMFVLSNVIIAVVLSIIDGIADSDSEGSRSTLTTLYVLAILIPSLAVGVRRLHDTGRSGWWMLIGVRQHLFESPLKRQEGAGSSSVRRGRYPP